MNYSVIVPVYNRPDEVRELLESLTLQTYTGFEIIIVEDGSDRPCKKVVEAFHSRLDLRYIVKENEGPGPARNRGAREASNEYLLFFDSDCLIPDHYMETVNRRLTSEPFDVFGGPDRAAHNFTSIQKAISYAMTSLFTTGGIRGSEQRKQKFYPRSFNMGISKKAFEAVDGFADIRFGEDVDLSLRLEKEGFSLGYLPDAFVYHKRRSTLRSFYKQVFNSGMARILLATRHPGSLKLIHALPSLFVGYLILAAAMVFFYPIVLLPLMIFIGVVFGGALKLEKSLPVALLAIPASLVQLTGYGSGFLTALARKYLFHSNQFTAFEETFYE